MKVSARVERGSHFTYFGMEVKRDCQNFQLRIFLEYFAFSLQEETAHDCAQRIITASLCKDCPSLLQVHSGRKGLQSKPGDCIRAWDCFLAGT